MGDQDVIHATRLEVVEYLHPEFNPLDILDPQAQDVVRAVGTNAQRQVDGLIANQRCPRESSPATRRRRPAFKDCHRHPWAQ